MALIINGQYVGDEILHNELIRLSANARIAVSSALASPALLQKAEQNVIEQVLLWQMAIDANLRVTEQEVLAERHRRWGNANNTICGQGIAASIKADLLVQKMREHLTRHVPRPTRVEQERAYHNSGEKYVVPERVLAAHVIRNCENEQEEAAALEALRQAEEELAAGHSFASVAKRYSDCDGDGQIGWVARGEMVQEFEDVVFTLKKGERSPIFRTLFGLHIAITVDHQMPRRSSFEEVRREVTRDLFEERKRTAIRQIVANVAQRSQIQYAN